MRLPPAALSVIVRRLTLPTAYSDTGEYEDIVELARLLDKKYEETGLDVNIHGSSAPPGNVVFTSRSGKRADMGVWVPSVDAASGGFVAPFVNPDLVWDFRIPRVVSINVSGHKYGLVSPGVGWAVWRSKDYLPEELVGRHLRPSVASRAGTDLRADFDICRCSTSPTSEPTRPRSRSTSQSRPSRSLPSMRS